MRRRPRQNEVSGCTGREGQTGCRFPPKYVVNDEPACIYHTVAAIERGLANPRVVVRRFS